MNDTPTILQSAAKQVVVKFSCNTYPYVFCICVLVLGVGVYEEGVPCSLLKMKEVNLSLSSK